MNTKTWTAFAICLCFLGLLINLFAFVNIAIPFLFILIFVIFVLIFTVIVLLRRTGDYFHPVSIFVFSFLIRLWLPAFLVTVGVEPFPFLGTEWWVGDAWQKGLILGALANFSLVLGWMLLPAWPRHRTLAAAQHEKVHRGGVNLTALRMAAWLGFITGLFFYLFFFAINFGFLGSVEVLLSGMLRGREVQQPGTSRYTFLAGNFLIWSSLILTIITYQSTRSLFRSFLPPLSVTLLYMPFGGRVVALTPLFMGLMGVWYSGGRIKWSRRAILLALLLVIVAIWIAPGIRAYRGGGGIDTLIKAFSPSVVLQDNILFWLEINMLHSYTYGVIFGPGSHTVSSLRYLFGGYTAYFLGVLDEVVHGTYIVWRVTGVQPDWGIHTGLPVDYYMSFGLAPMMGAMLLLGWGLKVLYQRLALPGGARSVARQAAYAFLFWGCYWLVYERGLGLLSLYESIAFLGIILLASKLLHGHKIKVSQRIASQTYFSH